MGLFSGISKAVKSVVGGLTGSDYVSAGASALGFLGGERVNEQSAANSAAQMAFQERMRNTSYQAAVADLKAAGLNPMLAYHNGGAAVPGGSQPEHLENSALSGAKSGLDAMQKQLLAAQIKTQESEAQLNSANAAKSYVEANEVSSRAWQTNLGNEQHEFLRDNWNLYNFLGSQEYSKTDSMKYESLIKNVDFRIKSSLQALADSKGYTSMEAALKDVEFKRAAQELLLSQLKTNEAQAYSDMHGTWYGKNVAPYVSSARDIADGVSSFIPYNFWKNLFSGAKK